MDVLPAWLRIASRCAVLFWLLVLVVVARLGAEVALESTARGSAVMLIAAVWWCLGYIGLLWWCEFVVEERDRLQDNE